MANYDIIGAEELLGTELSFGRSDLAQLLAGDDGGGSDMRRQAMVNQLAMRGGAAAVVTRANTKARVYVQGFGPTVIAAGATVNIIVQPQTTFKGKRLFIPSDFAGVILVNDLKIGNVSQLPSSNPLPGRMFTEFAVGVEQDFDTAQISQQISLSVTNTGGAPVTFMAGLKGLIVS